MATVIINEKTAKGKKLVEFFKQLDFVRFEDDTRGGSLNKAIDDVKAGKVIKAKDANTLLSKLKKIECTK